MRRKSVAIDIDGMLTDNVRGFRGNDIMNPLLSGAREFLIELQNHRKLVIFSCRSTEAIRRWCLENDLPFDEINKNSDVVTGNPGKVFASVYADDKAYRFDGDFDKALHEILNFKPWYER